MGETTYYQYDSLGRLTRKTDPENQITAYEYSAAGNVNTIRYYSAGDHSTPEKTVYFTYDNAGNIKSYDDGITSAVYEYDANYRKISETVNYGEFSLSYSYSYAANSSVVSSYEAQGYGLGASEQPG